MKTETNRSLLQNAANGGRWTALSAIASIVVQIAQLGILGRLLGPEDFGLMAMISVSLGFFNILADLGFGNYIIQVKNLSGAQFGSLLFLGTIASFILAVSLFILSPWLADFYSAPALESLFPAMAFILPFTTIGQIYLAILQREMLFETIAIGDILSSILGLTAATSLAFYGSGIWAMIIGQWTVTLTKTLYYGIASKQFVRTSLSLTRSELSTPIRFGLFQMGDRVLNYVGWNIDKLIIGSVMGEISLGVYSVIFQIIMKPLSIINPIFTRVALPLFSCIQDDDQRFRQGYLRLSQIIATITFPVYLTIMVSSGVIIRMLLGEKWEGASNILSILSMLGFIFTLGNPIGILFLAKGRADLGFYYNVFAVVTYAVCVYAGSQFGLEGVSLGFVFAAACILFPLDFLLRWHLIKMGTTEYISKLGGVIIATLSAIIFAQIFSRLASIHCQANTVDLFSAITGLLTYFIFLWLLDNQILKYIYLLVIREDSR